MYDIALGVKNIINRGGLMAVVFDTLNYTKGAVAVGIKREHAEYQAEQMIRLIDASLATKSDIQDLKKDLIQMEQRILIKLGSIMIAGITILGLIVKF